MRSRCLRHLVLSLLALTLAAVASATGNRLIFSFEGHPRTVFFYIPPDPAKMPLVLLLHGSGRDGTEMLSAWQSLAAAEHFILAAPNSMDTAAWDSKYDPPAFLHAVVGQIAAVHTLDTQRIYLFGHSGGAVYALALALIDSEFFAATAAHAGALPPNDHLFTYCRRHMPVALWVGDNDPFFSVSRVTATKALFDAHGFDVQLNILRNHGHDYSAVSEQVDRQAWEFLRQTALPTQPEPPWPAASP